MPDQSIIPEDLAKAARNLEEQLQSLKLETCNFPQQEWAALPGDIRNLIPTWIPALLSTYKISGAWLEFMDCRYEPFPILFAFLGPEGLELFLKPGSEYRKLIEYGFFPFAWAEGSGSAWVATIAGGPEGSVFYLEHTSWDGSEPTEKNGLIFPHKNLASLLSAVTVSDAN